MIVKPVQMPTTGDKTGIPATSEVKNKDVLVRFDRTSYASLINLLWKLNHNEIRSITIIKNGASYAKNKEKIEKLREVNKLLYQASLQSHSGHWDYSGEHGAGCNECIRAEELRKKAKKLLDETE